MSPVPVVMRHVLSPGRWMLAAALVSLPAISPAGQAPEGWQARAVVERYYAAIDSGDYRQAYGLWREEGAASGQDFAEFEAGFSDTAEVEVFTGPARVEGAAGSLHATVPVRIEAGTTGGGLRRFAGTYELQRVNDVPGASPGATEWHIASADIAVAGSGTR